MNPWDIFILSNASSWKNQALLILLHLCQRLKALYFPNLQYTLLIGTWDEVMHNVDTPINNSMQHPSNTLGHCHPTDVSTNQYHGPGLCTIPKLQYPKILKLRHAQGKTQVCGTSPNTDTWDGIVGSPQNTENSTIHKENTSMLDIPKCWYLG